MSTGRVLLVECADRRGLVHAITGVLLAHRSNVVGNQEFVDAPTGRFFMRTELEGTVDPERLEAEVTAVVPPGANVRLAPAEPKRVVVLATKEPHCLGDLLIRNAFDELNAKILAVVSNHERLGALVGKFDLPFHHVAAERIPRDEHDRRVVEVVASYQPDYIVLAKYMRILGSAFVARFPARIVNIHHSFLPAFVGAKPYQQAFDRGVKVIGATAHFVTDELDEGPIIVQQVTPVDHRHGVSDLARAGRDIEQSVLARALRLVFEDRVMLCANRVVIFA
jgi:formyltetrahydrofolate deformylase